MRFQAKSLLVAAAIVSISTIGYAAGHDHSMHEHAVQGHDHAAPGLSRDHSKHGAAAQEHDHSAHGSDDHSYDHAAHEQDHSKHGAAAQDHDHSMHEPAAQTPVVKKNILNLVKPAASSEKYTCPMHPAIITDAPGSCPICGMHLVKMVQGESGQKNNQVHVDALTQQRMGVQWQSAGVASMHRVINTFSTIAPDQTRSVSVSSFVEGWIKRWHVQGVGQPVKKGQVLYEIYSPDLQQRQREYLNLLTRLDVMQANQGGMGMSGAGKKVDMSGPSFIMMRALAKDRFRARDRLLTAGIPTDVLEQIEKHRRIQEVVPIRATQDGIVSEVFAREGSYINPAQALLVYTDNSRVWAEVTLYPDQIHWLKNGDEIMLTSSMEASSQARSRVDLSTLQIDPVSRTAKLRLPIVNVNHAFYPGSYAKTVIKAQERRVLSVPRDAVIRTGHGQYVVVSESPNHFRSVPVETGIENTQAVEIRSGLESGAQVVVNGQFLLDAAASLQSMQGRLAAASAPASHDHADASAMAGAVPVASAAPTSTHAHAHP